MSTKLGGFIIIAVKHQRFSLKVIDQRTIADRQYDGSGTPILFSDMAIMTVHEIKQVFCLPLRQCASLSK